jgi:hypothetical protein
LSDSSGPTSRSSKRLRLRRFRRGVRSRSRCSGLRLGCCGR